MESIEFEPLPLGQNPPPFGSLRMWFDGREMVQQIGNGPITSLTSGLSELTGNTLFVDAAYGDDNFASRGGNPFKTLAAAKTAASSGDTIHVRPGAYVDKNLLKNGVNWYFEQGAVVTYTGNDNHSIFDNTAAGVSGAVVCSISGRGVFNRIGDVDSPTDKASVLAVTNAGSAITLRAQRIYQQGTAQAGGWALWLGAGTNRVEVDELAVNSNYLIGWANGTSYVRASKISSTAGFGQSAMIQTQDGDDSEEHLYIDADEITYSGNVVMVGVSGGANKRVWIRAAHVTGGISLSAGLLYITSQKLELGASDTMNITGGTFYLTSQKLTMTAGAIDGGIAWMNIDEMVTSVALAVGGDDFGPVLNLTVKRWTATAGNCLNIYDGRANITGTLDSSANTGVYPVNVQGGTLVLQSAILVANAGSESIHADSAQNVVAMSSWANKAASGNVTITTTGGLAVNSAVA